MLVKLYDVLDFFRMLARIGPLVAQVRARHGLDSASLAARIGTDATIVERLEAGKPGVTTSQLDAIAAVLGLDSQALRRGEEVARPAPSVFLRHNGMQDFRDEDLGLLDRAIEQARDLKSLGVTLGEIDAQWIGTSFKRSTAPHDTSDAAAKHGYQLANELRKRLNLATEPLQDLRALTEERLSIAVVLLRLSIRGACAVKAGDAAAIVLSSGSFQAPARSRGAIAHELCHMLHDPDKEGVHIVLDLDSDRGTHANEQRARAFAAELLLPRAGLNGLFGVPRQIQEEDAAKQFVVSAMNHFGASWQITANHLCNREFVHRSLREWLEALEAHSLPSAWAAPLPQVNAPSLLMSQRAQRAHEQGLITDGEVREILGIDVLDRLPWDDVR